MFPSFETFILDKFTTHNNPRNVVGNSGTHADSTKHYCFFLLGHAKVHTFQQNLRIPWNDEGNQRLQEKG